MDLASMGGLEDLFVDSAGSGENHVAIREVDSIPERDLVPARVQPSSQCEAQARGGFEEGHVHPESIPLVVGVPPGR